MHDLAARLANRVQVTTDGHRVYLQAVESAFGADIDYAMLVKLYGNDRESETRYSPAECIGCRQIAITGKSQSKRYFDQLRRAPESHDAYADVPLHCFLPPGSC